MPVTNRKVVNDQVANPLQIFPHLSSSPQRPAFVNVLDHSPAQSKLFSDVFDTYLLHQSHHIAGKGFGVSLLPFIWRQFLDSNAIAASAGQAVLRYDDEEHLLVLSDLQCVKSASELFAFEEACAATVAALPESLLSLNVIFSFG